MTTHEELRNDKGMITKSLKVELERFRKALAIFCSIKKDLCVKVGANITDERFSYRDREFMAEFARTLERDASLITQVVNYIEYLPVDASDQLVSNTVEQAFYDITMLELREMMEKRDVLLKENPMQFLYYKKKETSYEGVNAELQQLKCALVAIADLEDQVMWEMRHDPNLIEVEPDFMRALYVSLLITEFFVKNLANTIENLPEDTTDDVLLNSVFKLYDEAVVWAQAQPIYLKKKRG
ncbi:MAG TPA: hypothetical protein PKK59_07790 [Anaerolineaceae bacterium]|nr:hypothetical protein [Anaerolineaceae bacterium]